MIKHISQLHISDSDDFQLDEDSIDDELPSTSYRVNMTSQELEDRLKNAQKITIAEQFKNSFKDSDNEIIPKLLLERMKQPCQSLVLWKPPVLPPYLISQDSCSNSATSDEENYANENNDKKVATNYVDSSTMECE